MKEYTYPSTAVRQRAEDIRAEIGHDPLYLTLLADLTTLSDRCQFALGPDGALVARYVDLPFAAISFYGEGAGLCEALGQVLEVGQSCYALIGEAQKAQLEAVVRVLQIDEEWQMRYRGDVASLDTGQAMPLDKDNYPAMRTLAERAGLLAFEANALDKGPYCGVWCDGQLVSMAGTHLKLERLVEIGNVATDPEFRRRGLARMAVSAVTKALCAEGLLAIIQVFKSNQAAFSLYEGLGFECIHTMYLIEFER